MRSYVLIRTQFSGSNDEFTGSSAVKTFIGNGAHERAHQIMREMRDKRTDQSCDYSVEATDVEIC